MVEKKEKLISKTLMVRLTGLGVQPRPQGFFLKIMGGAGKGPGIDWSRVQPKYSWEANLYATTGFALAEGSNNGK